VVDGLSEARLVPMGGSMKIVKCPDCGESKYVIMFSTSTCMYYPPIIKDGVNVNPDRNVITNSCQCLHCGSRFAYQTTAFGEVLE
jgi:hypothetical protein